MALLALAGTAHRSSGDVQSPAGGGPQDARTFATACSALADPLRARIIQLLAQSDMSAGEIAVCFPVSRPAVSRHLALLLRSQLVTVRSESGRRIYSVRLESLDAISNWIEQCRAVRAR